MLHINIFLHLQVHIQQNVYDYPGISFPLKQGFGWSFEKYDTIGFDFGNRTASIWGFYFNKTMFTESVSFEVKIGYYADQTYSHE